MGIVTAINNGVNSTIEILSEVRAKADKMASEKDERPTATVTAKTPKKGIVHLKGRSGQDLQVRTVHDHGFRLGFIRRLEGPPTASACEFSVVTYEGVKDFYFESPIDGKRYYPFKTRTWNLNKQFYLPEPEHKDKHFIIKKTRAEQATFRIPCAIGRDTEGIFPMDSPKGRSLSVQARIGLRRIVDGKEITERILLEYPL
jgi:hypothetical protein